MIANGNSNLEIDLGKYNTNDGETFANFVGLGGTPAPVYDNEIPGLPTAQRGIICVTDTACSANFTGVNLRVDLSDYSVFRAAFGTTFPDSGYDPLIDLNADGKINLTDYSMFRAQFGTSECPVCP